jgi:HK97 family phage prohead protease
MATQECHSNRARILDVREERKGTHFEFREDSEGNYVLEGYAATFTPYDVYGGPERGGWVETLTPTAFDRTLGESPDVMLLINHEGLPLARTKSGTLALSRDSHGLRIRATLDRSDPDVQALAPKLKPQANGRSNMDEMSFAFRVKDQVWDDNYTNRTITEVSLHKGDVSVVNFGMNPGTRAILQQGVEALSSLSHKELVELRRLDPDLVHRATVALASLPDTVGRLMPKTKRAWRSDDDHDLTDGRCATCENQRAKTPKAYANVGNFADPGYLDASGNQAKGGNGVKRYPIDAKHVQAAWSYINMPKNQKGYTPTQLAAVKSKIKAAMKSAGHDVSEDSGKQAASASYTHGMMAGVSHVDMVRNADGGTTLWAVMYDGSRTPLPSSPASTLQQGSRPAPGDARLGGLAPYVWDPFGRGTTQDPHDAGYDEVYSGDADDDAHENEVTAPQPSADAGSGFRDFGGKKAPPFKKGGGQGDEDEDDDETKRQFPDADDELGDYEGEDVEGAIAAQEDSDEDEHEDGVPDSEIDDDLIELNSGGPINVSRALHTFRNMTGIPDIKNVSDGLAYLRHADQRQLASKYFEEGLRA